MLMREMVSQKERKEMLQELESALNFRRGNTGVIQPPSIISRAALICLTVLKRKAFLHYKVRAMFNYL